MNHKELESEAKMDIIEKVHCSAIENSSQENTHQQNDILKHIIHSKAIFKSQHKDEPELSFQEKRTIALNLLEKSPSSFLSRFGIFLKLEHLSFFRNISIDDYAISFYLKRLQRNFDKGKRQVDVKNRRYEALKSLVEKGEYFSEKEMMKRNPLLYDHLIGRYLTEEEKKARHNIDTKNITFVNLLMESIERDMVRNFKQDQQDAEDDVDEDYDSDENSEEGGKCESTNENDIKNKLEDMVEEYDTDEESEGENNSLREKKTEETSQPVKKKKNLDEKRVTQNWGEISQPKDSYEAETRDRQKESIWYQISSKEQSILTQEFISYMYQSFLDGHDIDFDYSTVDDNEDYDNIELRSQDEEEKYFDSESPETIVPEKVSIEEDSEDELEAYMKTLEGYSPTNKLDKDTQ